jgi:ATP/maltotriose-dependent transcriptional regulator MalT
MQAVAAKMRFMVQQVSVEERAESAVYRLMTEAYNRFVALGIRYYEADALTWRGWAELNLGKTEQGMQHMLDSLAIRRDMGDRHGAAWVLQTLAHAYYDTLHDFAEAESCLRQAAVILREYHSIKGIVVSDTHLATMMLSAGDFEGARRMAEETFDLARSINHLEGEISALGLMAVLAALLDGHYDVAMAMARQSRAIHERALWVHPFPVVHAGMSFAACGVGDYALMRRSFKEMAFPGLLRDPMIASMVLGMEVVARAHENNPVSAVQLLALAQRLPEPGRRWMDRWELLSQTQAELNQQLGQAAYTDAWNRGAMLDLDAMLRHIADPDAVTDPAGSGAANQALPEPLTEREAEILALLAAGLSNLEIADHLVLSVGTVKVHTRHIYQKLGVGSRTQAIAKAAEIKLL